MNTDNNKRFGDLYVTQGTSDFFQGNSNFDENLKILKDKIREFFNLKNVNFLFGSGTSSGAINTISELFGTMKFSSKEKDLKTELQKISDKVGENLERCLNVMYSARNYYEGINENTSDSPLMVDLQAKLALYNRLIAKVERHIFNSINIQFNKPEELEVLEYYKTFYQKIALRNKDNSRIRVFTTNNDLFNETALDALSIHYINGFSGGLHKYFNPAIFNFTWSKRMDTSIDKYEPVENMVYLYKIHGSINWRETDCDTNNYFEIEEVPVCSEPSDKTVLIYPTPTKQDKSLGSPYVDLFREFQNKLLEPHSVLFIIGYSFNDRHVNDIIYRALATNSTINVVIFGCKPEDNEGERKRKPLYFINDNRIFTISGKEYKSENKKKDEVVGIINHFSYIAENLLPNLDAFRKDDNILNKFVESLKAETKSKKEDEDR